ncbi:MAG: hypothetical protein R3F45_01795 [Gammaproteobacteria bacterium]
MTSKWARTVWVRGVVVGMAMAAFGCGKDEGEVVHKEGDAEVRVKDQGDTVDITVKGEDGTATYSSGAGVELPSGFPEDVPTYPGMKLEFSGTQGSMFTVNGRTSDAMAKVSDALKAKAAAEGWSEVMSMNQQGAGGEPGMMMSYTKADRVLNVVLAGEGDGTNISIMTGTQ